MGRPRARDATAKRPRSSTAASSRAASKSSPRPRRWSTIPTSNRSFASPGASNARNPENRPPSTPTAGPRSRPPAPRRNRYSQGTAVPGWSKAITTSATPPSAKTTPGSGPAPRPQTTRSSTPSPLPSSSTTRGSCPSPSTASPTPVTPMPTRASRSCTPSQDPADRAHTPTETARIRAGPPNPAGLSLAPDPPKRAARAPLRAATGPQTSAPLTIADSNASTRAAIKTPIASQHRVWDLLAPWTRAFRAFRMLNVLDEVRRESLAIRVGRTLSSSDVVDVLSDRFLLRGRPGCIRSDPGPEFVAKIGRRWLSAVRRPHGLPPARIALGERIHGELPRTTARRTPERRDLLHPEGDPDSHRILVPPLPCRAPAQQLGIPTPRPGNDHARPAWRRSCPCANIRTGPVDGGRRQASGVTSQVPLLGRTSLRLRLPLPDPVRGAVR